MTTDRVDGGAVGRWLDVGEEPWLRELEAEGPPPDSLHLPEGGELVATLRRLGFEDPDVDTLVHAVPDPDRTREVWWLLERFGYRVIKDVGEWSQEREWGRWPKLPASTGVEGRCLWIWVCLAALPHIRCWHRERGIPDDVSWATLADLGRHTARYRRRTGVTGLESMGWFSLHFAGSIYALGRLQFELARIPAESEGPGSWYAADDPLASEPGLRPGDPALDTHIPGASGPMTPDACDASFAWASTFFATYFPEHTFRAVLCNSWLLDDQLAAYLPPSSNIVRFQRRYTLVPGAVDRDNGIFTFVFLKPPEAIDEIQPQTTLERAIVDHVRSGHHWRTPTGWLELSGEGHIANNATSTGVV